MATFYKDKLAPFLWDENNTINSEIRDKLLIIAKEFYNGLEFPKELIKDIQLTGSLANYNYNEYSDYDIHIIIDFKDVNKDVDLVKMALDGEKFIWNLRHNITIKGHEVEMYVQDVNEQHTSSGLYSLLKNIWIKVPKYNPSEVDEKDVMLKFNTYKKIIKRFYTEMNKKLSKNYAYKLHIAAKKLFEKIKEERKEGLKEEGELSIENIVFKLLRNSNEIELLVKVINGSYDQIFNELAMPLPSSMYRLNKSITRLNTGSKKRHQHPVGLPGLTRKHQEFVPDMHKADPQYNNKINSLLTLKKGKFICSPEDIRFIRKKFGVEDMLPSRVKKLGNTGIVLYYDMNLKKFVMEK